MRVDVWSDVVCPWCAVGKAHLEQALRELEHGDDVVVVWRSFELDPGAPAERDRPYDQLLAKRYGASPAGGRAMVARLSEAAERAGILARFDLVRPTRTFDAHRLLHLAKAHGLQHGLKTRLLAAYLGEGALLSDHATLTGLAVEAGLPSGEVRAALESDAYADDVRADQAEAARREITAVPTFLVDGYAVIPGAQSAASLLASLRRAQQRADRAEGR